MKRIVVIAAARSSTSSSRSSFSPACCGTRGGCLPGINVATIEAGSPAAEVLQKGDRIASVSLREDGRTCRSSPTTPASSRAASRRSAPRPLISAISTGGCDAASTGKTADGQPKVARCARPEAITVNYVRDGKPGSAQITPRYDDQRQRYRLGVAFQGRPEALGRSRRPGRSVSGMWFVTRETVTGIGKLFYDTEARKQVSGVVGTYEATRESVKVDPLLTLQIIAFISLSLAVINLFPFLPLDGGHIFWAIVEKLRGGKPVSTATLERASIIGLMLVAVLFTIGLSNDIGRITSGEGFGIQR